MGGIRVAAPIFNRGIRHGEWPAARTGCMNTLNKPLVTSVRKLFGFQRPSRPFEFHLIFAPPSLTGTALSAW
jgi:hypothetical protein